MTPTKIEIPYNGQSFFIDIAEGNMVNLNKIHEITGSSKNQSPYEWIRLQSTINIIKSMTNDNTGKSRIIKSKKGKGGGTWAHWQLVLSYAQYLSPELHLVVNRVFKERLEETLDPELGINRSRERAIKNWRKRGMNDNLINTRIDGIPVRNEFTGTLKEHQVIGNGYGICTNNIYIPLLGGKADDLRRQKGLKKSENIRDNLSQVELISVMFAETLASDKIKRENRQGNDQCAVTCLKTGMNVKNFVDDHEKSISVPKEPAISDVVRIESNSAVDKIKRLAENLCVAKSSRQPLFLPLVTLPVTAPVAVSPCFSTLSQNILKDFTVRQAASIFTISRFVSIVG